jgi:HSP20 family protein
MLARWNPWQDLFDVEREMSDLPRRVFGSSRFVPFPGDGSATAWTPAVDVFTRQEDLVVRAELPGVDPEKDVDITVQDGVLTIRGERRHEEKSEENGFSRFESSYGSFRRSVALPHDVKAESIQASYENGVLEVVIPKAAELSSAKRIPIAAGGSRKELATEAEKK